jgi:hypothetical protein
MRPAAPIACDAIGRRDEGRRARPAQVAELVDALVSGTSAFTGVEVRVLSWAPPLDKRQPGSP